MPQTVGVQSNPFVDLGVIANANSAHITQLGDDWETFYRAKRSSATRRRDRAKRKHMSEFGEIRFATAAEADDLRRIARHFVGAEEADFRAQRHCRYFCAARIPRVLCRFRVKSEFTPSGPCQPRSKSASTCAAANFAIVFGDCYYHVLSSYCDERVDALRARARFICASFSRYAIKARPAALRFHDRRRALQAGMVRSAPEAVRLQRGCDLARLAGRASLRSRGAALKRFVKQTPLVWQLGVAPALRGRRADPSASAGADGRRRTLGEAKSQPAARLRHGRHGFAAADRGGRHSLQRCGAARARRRSIRASRERGCLGIARKTPKRSLDALVRFGQAQSERPVLFYEEDEQLLLHLAPSRAAGAGVPLRHCRCAAGRGPVSTRRGLRIWRSGTACRCRPTLQFHPGDAEPDRISVFDFPIVIKPLNRG